MKTSHNNSGAVQELTNVFAMLLADADYNDCMVSDFEPDEYETTFAEAHLIFALRMLEKNKSRLNGGQIMKLEEMCHGQRMRLHKKN